VWIAGGLPGDAPTRLAIAEDPDEIQEWPIEGPPSAATDPGAPILAVCTNSSRDACCGIDGRALVGSLSDSPGVWECSHLGGHRFAPTALLVRDGLVYGRLDVDAARTLLGQGPGPSTAGFLRGRSALPQPAQAAEAHLLAQGSVPDVSDVMIDEFAPGQARVSFPNYGAVEVDLLPGEARPASCGALLEPCSAWRVSERS
jgi:hypothetical protein